jgi:beta-hydroxylase
MAISENSLTYKVIAPVVPRLIHKYERAIALASENRTFYPLADYPWTRDVERQFPVIQRELQALLAERGTAIPETKSLSSPQASISQGEWRSFMLYVCGHAVEENCARCPQTARIVKQMIPGMSSALFSLLAPGARLSPHRGVFKGVLRFHLGLVVPPGCSIRVGDDTRQWREGEALVFDDTNEHEVWNTSDRMRAILLVDFARDLPFPLYQVNQLMIKLFGISPFVQEIMTKLNNRVSDVLPS